MPDSKDTGEKQWPPLYAERHPNSTTLLTFRRPGPRLASNELETYLPLQIIRERLSERIADERAVTAAEGVYRATKKAADDPWDDTGWAEPMTDALLAALDVACEELLDAAFSKEEEG